ncbi:MAG: serine hydrolase [Verrucomicrobiales bacterium]|nr:serine hydrolase [Verrucomicrobiales bacterium]
MKKILKGVILPALIVFAIALALADRYARPRAEMAVAFKAKTLCAAAYISGRDILSSEIEDVSAGDLNFLKVFRTKKAVDSVTVSFFGLHPATAVFREGIGTTLAIGKTPEQLRRETSGAVAAPPANPSLLWPEGNRVDISLAPASINRKMLNSLIDSAFSEPDNPLRTRAIVIVYDGRVIAEKYAPGFDADMPLKGWSMAKSVTNALVGIMVDQGKLHLEDKSLLQAWQTEGDPRAAISLDNMLHMSSGIDFNETYSVDPESDISMMLFRTGNAAGFAATKPADKPPGTFFEYASGTTNLLCRIIREKINDDAIYHAFPKRELFHKIGAHSAILERDASGTFVGSSFVYATARDWARLGLLYANDGIWNEERILPEGWMEYCRTPAPAAPQGEYGAHFWLKLEGQNDRSDLPAGIFHMSGHEGQFVSISPEKKLVVVRLGFTLEQDAWNQGEFVSKILETL